MKLHVLFQHSCSAVKMMQYATIYDHLIMHEYWFCHCININSKGLLIFEDKTFRGLSNFNLNKKIAEKNFEGSNSCKHGYAMPEFYAIVMLQVCLLSIIKRSFLQHLKDLYTVLTISDRFKLLVWTWAGVD